jgi:pimeloyl-ACP methyl ester carboxylesterase
MKKDLDIILPGKHRRPIVADVFYNEDGAAKPVIIFAHGFKGFKDWGCWNLVAEHFASEGFVFVKFNFSHNGTTPEHLTEFADLEAFGNNNFSIELDDLGTVLDWIEGYSKEKMDIDASKLYLIGHSRGGGISIIKAKEDTGITKLVTWAAIAFFDKLFPRDIEEWEETGVTYTLNARTNQQMPLYFQLCNDLANNEERLDILDACIRIKVPFLIIHGTADEAVHYSQTMLLKRYAGDAELVFIEKGTHTFGCSHPWAHAHLPDEMMTVLQQTIDFLKA